MKKFALLAVTATIALAPAIADAKGERNSWWSGSTSDRETTVTETATYSHEEANRADAETKLYIDNTTPPKGRQALMKDKTYTFSLEDGSRIQLQGEKIYMVEADGYKYFAPNGPYTTRNGVTFIAKDGLVERTEAPDEVIYVDADNDRLDIRPYRQQ
jgi:hypothetical protein